MLLGRSRKSRWPILKIASVALAAAISGGCTNSAGVDGTGRMVQRYFGYLEVVQPPSLHMPINAQVQSVRAYGLKVENGITIGYSETQIVLVPMDCRAVIVVKTKAQLDQLEPVLTNISKEGDICAAVSPD